jgi:hypothetical protein
VKTFLEQIVRFGRPYIHRKTLVRHIKSGDLVSPLINLVAHPWAIDFADKVLMLIEFGFSASCRDSNGNTVLHILLSTETLCNSPDCWFDCQEQYLNNAALKALVYLILAGADVHACNNESHSTAQLAAAHGLEAVWCKVLKLCGYNTEDTLNPDFAAPKWTANDSNRSAQVLMEDYFRKWERAWEEKKLTEWRLKQRLLQSSRAFGEQSGWYYGNHCGIYTDTDMNVDGDDCETGSDTDSDSDGRFDSGELEE